MEPGPLSAKERGVVLKPLTDGFYYAFNLARPYGVKLLRGASCNRLRELLQTSSNPVISQVENDIDRNLVQHGLVSVSQPSATDVPIVAKTKPVKNCFVWLHIANDCNLSCHYCYIPHLKRGTISVSPDQYFMSPANATLVLRELIDYCERNAITRLHLKFAGGEPTLNLPLIQHMCKEARGINSPVNITFGMISNGTFLSADVIPILEEYQIRISISLDGFQDIHDKIRYQSNGNERVGTWKGIWTNVDDMVRKGIRPHFLCTVTPNNYQTLPLFSEFVHTRGLGFRLSLMRQRRTLPVGTQESILSSLVSMYENLGKTLSTNLAVDIHARFAEWELHEKKLIPCGAGRNYFAVDHEGNISCCQMRLDKKLGDLKTYRFEDILTNIQNDDGSQLLSNPAKRQGVCGKCEYFHVCAGGCPFHTEMVSGNMDSVAPWCHVYGKLLPVYIQAVAQHCLRIIQAGKI
jgi:uncharacterized protein